MISRVRGTLVEKHADRVVIEAAGVGYELEIPTSIYGDLPDVGREATLLAHLAVREDAFTLFGFLRVAERRLFRHLVSVSGVGPKLALNCLSAMRVDDIQRAILSEDADALTVVSGIGRKTARRMIVDLKSRIEEETGIASGGAVVPRGGALDAPAEATEALIALGYQRRDAWTAVTRAVESAGGGGKGAMSTENLIRLALRDLSAVAASAGQEPRAASAAAERGKKNLKGTKRHDE